MPTSGHLSNKTKDKNKNLINKNFGVALFCHEQINIQWTDEQIKDFLKKRLSPEIPFINCHILILSEPSSFSDQGLKEDI